MGMFSSKNIISYCVIILFVLNVIYPIFPEYYEINDREIIYNFRGDNIEGLANNSIVDLRNSDGEKIYIGTSNGLSFIDLSLFSVSENSNDIQYMHYDNVNLPEGGNPSTTTKVLNDSFGSYQGNTMIAVSGVSSSNICDDCPKGTGVSWSLDNGNTWNSIKQPVDFLPNSEYCSEIPDEDLNSWYIGHPQYLEGVPDNIPDQCYPIISGCSWNYAGSYCYAQENLQSISFSWNDENLSSFPITVPENNVSYDLSIDLIGGYVYAANWAGMLRRFKFYDNDAALECKEFENDNCETHWEIVPLPLDGVSEVLCGGELGESDPRDPPLGNHNHKAFSVYVENQTYPEDSSEFYNIWVGTADGVNKGKILVDDNFECISWNHFEEEDGLSGEWIIDIVAYDNSLNNGGYIPPRIHLISWNTSGVSPHEITYTENNGQNWNNTNYFIEQDAIIYNLYFDEDSNLYASTNQGLFYHFNSIQNQNLDN